MNEFLILVGANAMEAASALESTAVASPHELLAFRQLSELDAWRRSQRVSLGLTIEIDVTLALREIGCPRADLRGELATVIETLCGKLRVPRVTELAVEGMSERTLRRRWSEQTSEPPKTFLDRVRLLHARRLIEQEGFSAKEAAFRAGYSSVFALRQALLRRARTNAEREVGAESADVSSGEQP